MSDPTADPKLDKQPKLADPKDSYQTDLQIMEWDAGQWADAAATMGQAQAVAQGQNLKGATVPPFPELASFVAEYQKLQQWSVKLFGGAVRNLSAVAEELANTARSYDEHEQRSAGDFGRIMPEGP